MEIVEEFAIAIDWPCPVGRQFTVLAMANWGSGTDVQCVCDVVWYVRRPGRHEDVRNYFEHLEGLRRVRVCLLLHA